MDYKHLLESILIHLEEGIIVVDRNANITFYNEPASNIAGIEPEKATGKNILDVFPDLIPETSTFYYVLRTQKPCSSAAGFLFPLRFFSYFHSDVPCLAESVDEHYNFLAYFRVLYDFNHIIGIFY